MWRGERRGIDNGPAVRQQGVCACVCMRERERQRGVGEGQEGEISRKQSGQALCGAALGDCGGVYSVCVLWQDWGGECSCVCSIFQAGGLHAYSSMRIESGFVCVNMSANLCVRARV